MANFPLVSVIIPTFNRANFLRNTIESVLNQTYPNLEIIIVDDGSSDNTKTVINEYISTPKFQFLTQQNKGVSAARNLGEKNSSGKYIALLDSDDAFLPNKIQRQVNFLENNLELLMVHHYFEKVSYSGESLGIRKPNFYRGDIYPEILYYWKSLIHPSCIMVKASTFKQIGGFNENLLSGEDHDFFRKIAQIGKIDLIPEILAKITVHENNYSANLPTRHIPFLSYLEETFSDDPTLSTFQKKKALGKMFAYAGLNLIGKYDYQIMKIARNHSIEAIKNWPFQIIPLLVILFSFVPFSFRKIIYLTWAKIKYPTKSRGKNDY